MPLLFGMETLFVFIGSELAFRYFRSLVFLNRTSLVAHFGFALERNVNPRELARGFFMN